MSILRDRHGRILPRFLKSQNGAITVDAVLWIPLFLVLFGLIVDLSLIFHGQSKAQRILQDANRFASTGWLETEAQIEAHTLARLKAFSPNATVQAVLGTDDVRTFVSVPASDLDAIGFFSRISGITLTISAAHLLEV